MDRVLGSLLCSLEPVDCLPIPALADLRTIQWWFGARDVRGPGQRSASGSREKF